MPKYLLLKHYRGGPEPHNPFPRWTSGHLRTWSALRLSQARQRVARGERRVRRRAGAHAGADLGALRGGPDAAPVTTDGPLPETNDLVAGWYMIDVDSRERALEVAAYISLEPGPGGTPLYEWIDVREVMSHGSSEE